MQITLIAERGKGGKLKKRRENERKANYYLKFNCDFPICTGISDNRLIDLVAGIIIKLTP